MGGETGHISPHLDDHPSADLHSACDALLEMAEDVSLRTLAEAAMLREEQCSVRGVFAVRGEEEEDRVERVGSDAECVVGEGVRCALEEAPSSVF